ncbi:C-C motif chemokine 19-like [Sphaeramia orbicularis]|uniref:C-C motif chemokine 19-like n=1 Tax=Sphaeramia orbicularis TaxID=375764 RepID=A0A672Z6V1_9TELE|nr:C-C motif chemokine 19-like [Sphaeramia orbicularis]
MDLWVDAKVFICILFVTFFCTGTDAEMPADCCLEVKNKEVDKAAIVHYQLQTSGHGCAINAMVLLTRHQRTLCVPHNEPWVKNIMNHVDNLKKFCKKRNHKPRVCRGVQNV